MFLFTFMLTILCFMYHLSHLFWVTFPWPGHTPHWNPVLMIPINVCYTLMMVRQRCWLSMLRTVLLFSLISFKWPLWICYYTCLLLSHWWHKTIGWRHHNVSFHLYADNTLLYVSFESSILGDLSMARAHSTLESCAHDTDKCLLYINDGETEMLIIHAKDRPALLLDKL